jgi:serine/threonine protein kinase
MTPPPLPLEDYVDVIINGSQSIRLPRRFGRYEYLKTLGGGCSSAVVLVRHSVSSTLFACKVVSRAYLVAENIFDRFEQEVRLLPSLRHPNIVNFEEIVFDPELIYLVMEYCSQGDLFSHILNHGVFPDNRAREITQQIAEAVRYIHGRDIAHRDLKPENILLDRGFNAKLADFGFCHISSSKNLLRTPCGSPFYAPPEIISNMDYDGKSADIWSLGIVLFTMVTGSFPWSADNRMELFRQIRACDIEIPPTLSPALQELLGSMLQRDPSQRCTIGDVLNSPWFPKTKNGPWRGCLRAASWAVPASEYRAPDESHGLPVPNQAPAGPRRLLVRPRRKTVLTANASLAAGAVLIAPVFPTAAGRRPSVGGGTPLPLNLGGSV